MRAITGMRTLSGFTHFWVRGADGVRHGPVPGGEGVWTEGPCDWPECVGCAVRCMEESLEPEWEIFV